MRSAIFATILLSGLLGFGASAETTPPPADDAGTDVGRAGAAATAVAPDAAHVPAQKPSTASPIFEKPQNAGAQHDVAPEVAARAAEDQIICRITPIVGSRLSSRLCLSLRRWKQMNTDANEFIRDIQQRSNGGQTN